MKSKMSYFLLSLLPVILYLCLLFGCLLSIPVLGNDSSLILSEKNTCFRIKGTFNSTENAYDFRFRIADSSQSYAIAFVNPSSFSVKTKSEVFYAYPDSSHAQRQFIWVSFPESLINSGEDFLSFSVRSASLTEPCLLIGDPASFRHIAALGNMARIFILGMLCMLVLYSLNLCLHKSGEIYLTYYFCYVSLLFFWETVQLIPPGCIPFLSVFITEAGDTVSTLITCLAAAACLHITGISLSSRTADFLRWYSILAACIFSQIFCFFGFSFLSFGIRCAYWGLGFCLVFRFSCRQSKGSLFLLSSYLCTLLWPAHIFCLPLSFACMNLIHLRFSQAFADAKDATERLQDMNLTLDQKVTQRTLQVIQQQQEEHNMLLNIFHDLRSPLFIIREYINLLEDDYDSAKAFIPALKERIAYLGHLTEDLFLIAKLENENVLFNEESLFLPTLLTQVCRPYEVSCRTKSISFSLTIASECYIWGDKIRLTQAFSNLLGNAVTHTPHNGTISVSVHQDNPSDFVIISVYNTGIPIPGEDLEKIFIRYYSSNRTASHTHTGLGLSIAYEIIRHHYGKITVESSEETGTAFTVTLPRHIPNAPAV